MPPTLPNTLTNGTTADASQVMADLNAINAAVDQATVTSLPGSPYDGQEIYYLADATNGIVWHLKYRSGSGSAYKWEFVGGPPMRATVTTGQVAGSNSTWVNLATDGPSVTVPLAGDYDCDLGAQITVAAANVDAECGLATGNGTPSLTASNITESGMGAGTRAVSPMQTEKRAGHSASDVVKLRFYSSNAANTTFYNRWLRVRPYRVG